MRVQPIPIRPAGGATASTAAEGSWQVWLAFALAMLAAAAILVYFHDRFWWPPDDGAYAYVAERILAGDVLNRDVQDVHAGYVNFANAAALALFGMDLVSLRYPLALLTLLQCALLFGLFAPLGAIRAGVAAVAMASLSFVQFLNPTAHWYCLFLFMALLAALVWLRPGALLRLELVGFLLVALLLFRQLTGVLVAIGVLGWLLAERSGTPRRGRPIVARLLVAVMFLGLGAYLATKSDPLGFVLFGVWPMGLLVWLWRRAAIGDGEALRMLGKLALGGVVAFLPLLAYHLAHGSLASWFQDVVLAAGGFTELEFFDRPSYGYFLVGGLRQLLAFESVSLALNGIFWLTLPLLGALQGAAMWFSLWRSHDRALRPLPFLAVFYPLVSTHYQIAIYLFYGTAVSLAGLLWLAAPAKPAWRLASLLLALLLSAIGLYWQAGQPLTRGAEGILRGERVLSVRSSLERASLWITPEDEAFYAHAGELAAANLDPGATLLAIPFDPELNFLFARPSPVRFYNVALGVRDRAALDAVLAKLAGTPPGLVFYKPDDKYNVGASKAIADHVRRHYELLESRDGFEIYRLKAPGG
jgi:hypothetical protein